MRALISGVAKPPARLVRGVHQAAVQGFGNTNIDRYERGRPSYPSAALEKILSELSTTNLTAAKCVVELGSGTGKFTQSILPLLYSPQRDWSTKLLYVATEPVDSMRTRLQELVKGNPRVKVAHGTGDCIPVEDGSAVAAIAAQSFHWMATMPTLREIHRVLVPGGLFVGIWNTFDYSRPLVAQIEKEIIDPCYDPDVPRQITHKWKQVFLEQEAGSLFHSLEEFECLQEQVGPFDMVADRVMSISVIAKRSPEQLADIRERLRAILETAPDTRGKDVYTLHYRTELYWGRRK